MSMGTQPTTYWETEPHHHEDGASTGIGFWVYLMSDCLMFAVLFATFGVLHGSYAAGPGPKDLFDLELVAINTAMLLFSSITYGFAMLDLQLHETDSLSIADRLDELDVPFAFVTGFASTRPDLHDHGAVAVLSKPVPVEGLRAVLEQVLGLREPETPT